MKKALTLLVFAPALAVGQSLVSTTPQNRTALLEDFTGIHCGYCPDGHAIMAGLADVHGEKLVSVGVHAGIYAEPSGSDPDFRTPDGTAIDAFFPITGYPAGVINRHTFAAGLALGRGSWEGAVNEVLDLPSPVNVGVESSVNGDQLTVHVVAYYTANSPAGNDYFSVLIKEDHLIGWQTDYANGNHTDYDHLHVLRDYVTDTWGEDVGNPMAGETVERTYTYTIPAGWNIANLQVTAFVSEYQSEVYQAKNVAADGGTTLIIGALEADAQPYRAGIASSATTFAGGFTNALGATEDYIVTLSSTDAPATWQGAILVNGGVQSNPTTTSIAGGAAISLDVAVTPDAAPGIGTYLLTVASASNPGAPVLTATYHVISNVHDLIVNNPQAEAHEPLYTQGMATENFKAVTNRGDFVAFGQAGALSDVLNLYLNISWTFPSYTDEVANVLSDFMDDGGNLMIAGQDIGWDQSGVTGAYGTAGTQAFYTNYLHATYVADGSSADTQVLWETSDAVFGNLGNSTIANVFSGNTYPDQITPIAPAVPIMRYSATKIGALRAQTANYKVVYFGIGPEQVANAAVGRLMVQASHDWFYGLVSIEEMDALLNSLGQAYPSPANDVVNIPVGDLNGAAVVEVMDATGRLVMTESVQVGRSLITLGTAGLNDGLYTARMRTSEGAGKAVSFMVAR